ncbi:hypothetical protein KCU81_g1852, partial [Aureobasidium melanogenum]|uniref:DASH complex subunit DAD4 n=1 Tax=Aureobasidium melanogenum (strain CBS 110374) TaxID=1043003 RepID=A0A074VY03_AURM1
MTQSIAVSVLGLVPEHLPPTPPNHQSINMESPHEHQQNVLLSRIITNVEKLNEAVMMLNKSLQEININNMDVELVAQMFKNYQSNVLFHLEATDNLREAS